MSQPRPSQSEGGASVPRRKKGNLIGVWIDDDMLARLDMVIKPGQTRPQAIREILEKNL